MSKSYTLSTYEKSYIHGQIMTSGAVNAYFEQGHVSKQFVERAIELGRFVEIPGGIGHLEGVAVKGWKFTPAGVEWAYTCGLLDAEEIAEAKATDARFGKPVVGEEIPDEPYNPDVLHNAIYDQLDVAVKSAKAQSSNDMSFRSFMSKSSARIWTQMYPEIYSEVLKAN